MRMLPKSIHSVALILSITAGICLLFIAGLTVADVVLRNIANKSILGTSDISSLLLVAIAFLGLSSAEIDGRHVSVELLEMHLARHTRCVLSIIRTVLFVVLSMVVVWGLIDVLLSAVERNETTNGILRLPTWPAKIVLLISFSFYFCVVIWKSIINFSDIRDDSEKENNDASSGFSFLQCEQLTSSVSHARCKGEQL